MDLIISFSILNCFWWTKDQIEGNNVITRLCNTCDHLTGCNRFQLVFEQFWMIFEMRQPATRITPNLGNHNQKIDQTTVRFSSVLWIFSVHRTELANTKDHLQCILPTMLQSTTMNLDITNVHDNNCQTLKTWTRWTVRHVTSLFPAILRGVHDLKHSMSFQHRLATICIFEIWVNVLSLTFFEDGGNFFLRFWPCGEQITLL